ncbi:MAG: M56 family metallopeptidase [Bacteroidetes bacterium]|nr:M56 family metallopeptidase [Bacteroidota bacterium]
MIVYLIKTIICSALFLAIYKILLEKEKMHVFNRFYLLSCIVLSFIAPILEFKTASPVIGSVENVFMQVPLTGTQHIDSYKVSETAASNFSNIPYIIYFLITSFFLLRFLINLKTIVKKVLHASKIRFGIAKLILIDSNHVAHSFLNYIFLNKEDYSRGIENEILWHESAHIRQKHSYDVLLIELVQVFFWFNPCWSLYRRAIQLNHEFLADDAVIASSNNIAKYQQLLIEVAGCKNGIPMTSRFNYLITKKRMLMLTKSTNTRIASIKGFSSMLFIGFVVIVFASRTYAQEASKDTIPVQQKSLAGSGASKALLDEYDSTINKMTSIETRKDGKKIQAFSMAKCNIGRMAYLYSQMNEEQRSVRNKTVGMMFIRLSTPPAKRSPTTAQLRAWADSKKYGVWLDGKRISNAQLSKYSPTDFALFWESKLAKNALNYGKHYYQIDLCTSSYYQQEYVNKRR